MTFELQRGTLIKLGEIVADQGRKLAGIGDRFTPVQGTPPAMFGALPATSEITAAVGALEAHVHEDLSTYAKLRCDQVDRALDTIEANVRKAEDASSPRRGGGNGTGGR
ncbi:hypothetical protein [Sphaerisporangium rufum]|nr:hypothetical protein [Sphaerisporangium rufum]